jgi:uroporphyrinogen decarboxylase
MSDAKPLLEVLHGTRRDPPPFWLMRQAGRYLPEYRGLRQKAGSFLDLCYTPEFAAAATLQPIERFGMDAAILFSDILVIADALGRNLRFRDGDGPQLDPLSRDTVLPAALDRAKLTPVYAAIRLVKAKLPARTTLIGFAGGAWTVAAYMVEGGGKRGFERALAWARDDAENFGRIVDGLVAATIEHLSGQIEAGAEAVQLFDSWAGLLDAAGFARWVIEPTRTIVAALKRRHPAVPVIGFPRQAGSQYAAYAGETGVDAIGLDQDVPLAAAAALQAHGPVQGNLDPRILVAGGAALDAAVRAIRGALGKGPFVFNLGHGILPETPTGHVERLGQLLREGG